MSDSFKICLAGTSTSVEGTTTFATYDENDPERPGADGSKYVILPSDML